MTDRLAEIQDSHPLPTWRVIAWPAMLFLTIALIWANYAELDEVTMAMGDVVPQGKVKVIQHLEGGIIEDIYVTEGAIVKADMPLIQLDLGGVGANLEELQIRLDGLLLRRARIQAEAEGIDLEFPKEVEERQPAIAQAEREAFDARKTEYTATINVLKQQVLQRELDVDELNKKKSVAEKNLRLAKERFRMSGELLKEKLVPKMEHLELEAEVEDLEGQLQSLGPAIPRAQAAVDEAQERLREGEIRFRREAKEQSGEVEQEIARVRELLSKATEQGLRTEIKSPIEGVVKNMRYNTIGGVVKPGEPIMEIVPTGDKLIIEAKLNPTDRGYVEAGQKTVVKISTYDFVRYGGLDGEVVLVAPDSSTDEEGNPYYRVVVHTDKTHLGAEAGALPIMPGMQATVDIHTGTKSVMDYLIKPVLKLKHESFRER